MRNIIQIVPTYPPNIGGVGHYAKLLAQKFTKKVLSQSFWYQIFPIAKR